MNFVSHLGICLFLTVNIVSAHDIHVSVAELSLEEDGHLELSLRIFFDDLLMACGLIPGEELPEGYESSDELIEEYVSSHFKLYLGGERVSLMYKESFSDNLAVWIELKSERLDLDQISTLELENTILLKEFEDQLNILNCSGEQLSGSYTFNHKKPRKPISKN